MLHRVRNAVRGLLTLDLPGGRSLHLGFRETVELSEEDYASQNVQRAISKHLLLDRGTAEKAPTVLVTETEEDVAEEMDEPKKSNGKKARRRKKAKE